MMIKYKAVIYDLDGCLVQSLDVWVDAFKLVLGKEGVYPTTAEIMRHLGNWNAPVILGHTDLKTANKELIGYVCEHMKDVAFYPNALETMQSLKHEFDMCMYIVSSNKRTIVESTEAYKQIEPLIDFAVFADDVKSHKPDPEAINLIINQCKLNKNEVILVGDSANDMMAAANAGIDSAWFKPDMNKTFHPNNEAAQTDPTLTIEDHQEFIPSCMQMSSVH